MKFSDYVQPDPKDGVNVSFKLPNGDTSALLFGSDATMKVGYCTNYMYDFFINI